MTLDFHPLQVMVKTMRAHMGLKNTPQRPPEKITSAKIVCTAKDDDSKVKLFPSLTFGPKSLSHIFLGYVPLLLEMSPLFQR